MNNADVEFIVVVNQTFWDSLPLIWFGAQIALESYSRNRSTGTPLNIPNW